jgi:hypothetical protein
VNLKLESLYRELLKLYPAEYRAVFAEEMLCVFHELLEDNGRRELAVVFGFALRETTGLLRGVSTEWNAKLAADAYRSARLIGASSLLANCVAKLIYALYRSNILFTSRCVPDLRLMRPAGTSWDSWFGAATPRSAATSSLTSTGTN